MVSLMLQVYQLVTVYDHVRARSDCNSRRVQFRESLANPYTEDSDQTLHYVERIVIRQD